MQITVLGKSPSWQDADGACSGYLIQDGEQALLLDCGNGVFSKLRRVVDYVNVGAVVISHLHADHFLDLVPFSYALTYAPRQQPVPVAGWPGTSKPVRPKLYAPTGARELFRNVVGCWGNADLIEHAFDLHEYEPTDELAIGPFTVKFCKVPALHADVCGRAARSNGSRMTYSADCSPNDELVRFALRTDMLLIEATLPRHGADGERGHRRRARPATTRSAAPARAGS